MIGKILRAIGRTIKNIFGSKVFKKALPFIVVFIIGAVAGGVFTDKVLRKSDSKGSQGWSNSSSSGSANRASRQSEQIETNYKRAKEDIAKDQKSGRITKEQADKLSVKVEEIYKFRTKDLRDVSDEEARKQLSAKRAEWRKWASENSLSSRYFLRLTM